MQFGVETTAAIAAIVAAAAAIWQGVLTRAALTSSFDNSLAQERLVRLSGLYTALQETRQLARRLSSRPDGPWEDLEVTKLFALIDRIRADANLVALAYSPIVFGDLYSRLTDFVVWFSEKGAPPSQKSTLDHIADEASELSGAVFNLSATLNMSRKN